MALILLEVKPVERSPGSTTATLVPKPLISFLRAPIYASMAYLTALQWPWNGRGTLAAMEETAITKDLGFFLSTGRARKLRSNTPQQSVSSWARTRDRSLSSAEPEMPKPAEWMRIEKSPMIPRTLFMLYSSVTSIFRETSFPFPMSSSFSSTLLATP